MPASNAARAELADDAACYDEAQRTIRHQPAMFAALSAYRVAQLWSPLPNLTKANTSGLRRQLRYPVAAWYIVVYVLAMIAALRGAANGAARSMADRMQSPWMYGVALCLVFTAIHSVYWSNLRMRAPLMPFAACAAAAGASCVASKWLQRSVQ